MFYNIIMRGVKNAELSEKSPALVCGICLLFGYFIGV